MKRTLKEDLERIHGLTYGKKVLNESFIDNILNKVGLSGKDDTKKIDDPKKADLVTTDVQQFFDNIKKAADGGGISQQGQGSMTYQKEVESIQIGLMMLGYELPKHGVDGLFGPETAAAVEKFTNEKLGNQTTDKPQITESSMVQLKTISYPNLKHDFTNGTESDFVNQGLLDDLNKAASSAGLVATITTAKSGHDKLVKGGKSISRHMDGTGVDIAILDGTGAGGATNLTNGNAKFRELGNRMASALESMGYVRNVESGNPKAVLWQTNTGGNHYNHLHVSNKIGASELPASVGGGSGLSGIKATPEMLNKLLELLKQKGVTSEDLKKYIDSITTGGGVLFTDLDLKTEEGKRAYTEISQKFIDTRKPNLLGITGEMMMKGAERAFKETSKYVPPELALAQLAAEGGIGNNDPSSRPIRTKNPFNVGNTDSGANVQHGDVQSGINTYYSLIGRNYLGKGKTANDLVQNFVNKDGNHYAIAGTYEKSLQSIVPQVNRIAQPIYAKLNKTTDSNLV